MDYRMIDSVDGIREYIGDSEVFAFDYETAPDEAYRHDRKAALDPHRSHIVGCSFSVSEGTGIYVPVAHRIGVNIDNDEFWDFMKELLESDRVKIAHNLAFESMMSYKMGIVIQTPVYDTIAAAQLFPEGEYALRRLKSCGLKTLAREWYHEPLATFSDVTADRHFDELDPEDFETIRYGCADSDFALRIYHDCNDWFDRHLPKHRFICEQVESPSSVYVGIMKYNGVPVDEGAMKEKSAMLDELIENTKSRIRYIIGDVDIGETANNKAFRDYVFGTLDIPVLAVTDKGLPALNDEAIILIKDWCRENLPHYEELFELVQELRKLKKIKSTYIVGYGKYISPETGCIHPDFLSMGADTGRMSCHNPNLQNMPRRTNDPVGIREMIRPKDGVLLSLDFSQIELRVGAFYCRDDIMLETYRKGGDIHAATTSVIFNITQEEALDKSNPNYKERRTIAKNVNFGTFYGLFPNGLRRTLNFKAGLSTTLEECEKILGSLKEGYPGLTRWQKMTVAIAGRNKFTETFLGRRRYLPEIDSEDWGRKSFAQRCALNTPIQGTAADILKLALARILKGLPDRPWLKPILQIHDELVFTVPEEKLDEAVEFVKSCMEEQPFPEFDVPLIAEAEAGADFGNMKDV